MSNPWNDHSEMKQPAIISTRNNDPSHESNGIGSNDGANFSGAMRDRRNELSAVFAEAPVPHPNRRVAESDTQQHDAGHPNAAATTNAQEDTDEHAAVDKEKLEQKRYLNRLTWRRKHIREKMQLMQLKRSQSDLTEKNRILRNENRLMKEVASKLNNKTDCTKLLRQLEEHQQRKLLRLAAQTQQQRQQQHGQLQAVTAANNSNTSLNFAPIQHQYSGAATQTQATPATANQALLIQQRAASLQQGLSRLQQQNQFQQQQQSPSTISVSDLSINAPQISTNTIANYLGLQVSPTENNSFLNQQAAVARKMNSLLQPNPISTTSSQVQVQDQAQPSAGFGNPSSPLCILNDSLGRTAEVAQQAAQQSSDPTIEALGTAILAQNGAASASGIWAGVPPFPQDLSTILHLQAMAKQRQDTITALVAAALADRSRTLGPTDYHHTEGSSISGSQSNLSRDLPSLSSALLQASSILNSAGVTSNVSSAGDALPAHFAIAPFPINTSEPIVSDNSSTRMLDFIDTGHDHNSNSNIALEVSNNIDGNDRKLPPKK